MKRASLLSATFIVLAASGRALAAGDAGASSFDFLMLDANARAVALGGAYGSLACDSNALNYNPAGLACVKRNETTFMHNQYAEGITQEYLGLALKQGFGVSLNYLRFGGIPRTTYSRPDGNLGQFDVSDAALGLGYGRRINDNLRAGASLKFVREANDSVSASGVAFDLGGMATVPDWDGVQFGASLQNLGPSIRYGATSEKLPQQIRMGMSYTRKIGLVSFDMTKQGADKVRFALGAEVEPVATLLLRLGLNTKADTGPGIVAGFGWNGPSIAIDYALSLLGDLGLAHRISATYRWGEVEPEPRPEFVPKQYKTRLDFPTATLGGARLSKNEIDLLIIKARKLVAAKKYAAARDVLKTLDNSLVEMDQRRADYLELLGRVSFELGNVEAARQYYTESLNIGMGLGIVGHEAAKSYEGLGRCLEAQKSLESALDYYGKAYDLERTPERKQLIDSLRKKLESNFP